jgi:hypothetical protein
VLMTSKNNIATLRGKGEREGAEGETLGSLLIVEVCAAIGLVAQFYAPMKLDFYCLRGL